MPVSSLVSEIDDVIDQMTRVESARGMSPHGGFQRLLVALDGSAASKRALAWSQAIASASGGKVRLVTSLGAPAFDHGAMSGPGPIGGSVAHWRKTVEGERGEAQRVVSGAVEKLRHAGIDVHGEVVVGRPGTRIAREARDQHADLLLVGGHKVSLLERVLLGSVANQLRAHAPSSILIANTDPPPKRILVPTDGSAASRDAVAVAIELAATWHADTDILHVVTPPAKGQLMQMQERRDSSRAPMNVHDLTVDEGDGKTKVHYEVRHGDAYRTIVDYADAQKCGLIVMGARGLGRATGALLGSVSDAVSKHARASVLVLRNPVR